MLRDAAKVVLDRGAETLKSFFDGVDAFRKKADAEIAAKEKARQLEESARPRGEPSREELDRQLREIARRQAQFPNQEIEPVERASHRTVTGRVLGYTQGREEALFERLSGELYRLDMRGKPRLEVSQEINYDRTIQGIKQVASGSESRRSRLQSR